MARGQCNGLSKFGVAETHGNESILDYTGGPLAAVISELVGKDRDA